MKTDELIALLARSPVAVDRAAASRRFHAHLAAAIVACAAIVWFAYGPRPDWRTAIELPMFWLKLAFPAATGLAALLVLHRLGHPGMRLKASPAGLILPLAMVWLMTAAVLMATPPDAWGAAVLGTSWRQCVLSILALSIPAFILAFAAMRTLAPTRLALAGATAGLFAGCAAAFAYAIHCTEMQAPFLGVWYAIGMLVPAGAGALLGPRVLRW